MSGPSTSDAADGSSAQSTSSGPAGPWWRSRRALVGAVVLVVAGAAGVVAALQPPSGSVDASPEPTRSVSPSPSPTPSSSPTAEPTPTATAQAEPAPTTEPTDGELAPGPYEPTTEPAVGLEEPGVFGTGVVARLISIEAVEGIALGPGEVSGPSLRLTVELTNDSAESISLETTVVELYAGPDATPGNLLAGDESGLFSGELAAGASATGVYVFRVDPALRDQVQVTVSYTPGAPTVLFEGAAPAA